MKFLCRALCVLIFAVCVARAAQEEDDATFGDYAPTLDDDLIQYIPKYTVRLGFRGMSGVKAGFGGNGLLSSAGLIGDATGIQARTYHDGAVGVDTRTVFDPAGNSVPITPDGRTNTWNFTSDTQATGNGLIAMHAFTAQVTDSTFHEKDPAPGYGVELAVERDIGKVFGTRMHWGFVGGMSMNQFSAITSSNVAANVTTITDYYSLGGQSAPPAPYTAPEFSGQVDVSTLLGNQVLQRTTATSASTTAVLSSWKLRGAYMTFRAGPTLYVPIGSRFSASFSAGAVLVYAGSTYDITQTFKPETGDDITQTSSDGASTFLPGYYVDANVQWAINDTSGLYLGAVYQSSGDYVQSVKSGDGLSTYSTRIDLSSLQGIRAGVSFKF